MLSLWLIERSDKNIIRDEFKHRYGTIVAEIDIAKSFYCRYYYPLQMIRGMIYVVLLVAFSDYPKIQLVSIPVLLNFPVYLAAILSE